jgi:hypothetical protein
MPLNKKGKKILKAMKEQYGSDAKKVFYASKNKGVIKNVEKKMGGGLSGGKRFGPPPEKGPNPQGLKVKKAFMGLAVQAAEKNPYSLFGAGAGLLKRSDTARSATGLGIGGKFLNDYFDKEEEKKEQKPIKAYLGKEIKQPTETKKEFGTRHEVHTKLKESEIYRKGSKVSDASPKLKEGGMSCPYRRGGKTSIQGVSKIQVKGQKFTGVK